MKKIYLIITALAITILTVNAQSVDFNNTVNIGVKAGLNYSNVYDSEGEEFDANPKLGIAGGLFLAIPLNEHIGIQPELLLSQRGFQASGRLLGSEYNFTHTTTFVDVPLL